MKCQHEWEYFDEHDFPNGYEYDQWNIPHKRCKKCGREYELFDGYGEYANRWRKVEPWSPELHKLEQELIRTRKALEVAKSKLNGIHRLYSKAFYTREDWLQVCMEMVDKANTALEQITALEQKGK
jgi:hypothetical protein